MKGIIKKADIVLAVILAAICGASAIFAFGLGESGNTAVVSVDGEVYGTYDLGEDQVVEIDDSYGHNRLEIKDGKILMTEADCPDGYCMGQYRSRGGIDDSSQTIVCLPHRLVVTVEVSGSDEDGSDAVTGQVYTDDGGKG